MFNLLFIKIINQILKPNSGSRQQLIYLMDKSFNLILPFGVIRAQIDHNGYFEETDKSADFIIEIPLAAASHLIHKEQLRTLRHLTISGETNSAQKFLEILTKLKINNLYTNQPNFLGLALFKLEVIIKNILNYLKLIATNATKSSSQYLQYETKALLNKYELEKFYNEVDEINERYQLLYKRIEYLILSKNNTRIITP